MFSKKNNYEAVGLFFSWFCIFGCDFQDVESSFKESEFKFLASKLFTDNIVDKTINDGVVSWEEWVAFDQELNRGVSLDNAILKVSSLEARQQIVQELEEIIAFSTDHRGSLELIVNDANFINKITQEVLLSYDKNSLKNDPMPDDGCRENCNERFRVCLDGAIGTGVAVFGTSTVTGLGTSAYTLNPTPALVGGIVGIVGGTLSYVAQRTTCREYVEVCTKNCE